MSKEVVVALIAAGGAVVVSVLAFLGSLATMKSNARLQKSLEADKARAAQALLALSLGDKEFVATQDALHRAVSSIQRLKDEIQLLLNSVSGSMPIASLEKRLSEQVDELMKTYEDCSVHFNKEEDRAVHDAKNLSLRWSQLVATTPIAYSEDGQLSAELSSQLLRIREDLSEAQQKLRDSRSLRFEQRVMSSH